jgi:hypothetical protein
MPQCCLSAAEWSVVQLTYAHDPKQRFSAFACPLKRLILLHYTSQDLNVVSMQEHILHIASQYPSRRNFRPWRHHWWPQESTHMGPSYHRAIYEIERRAGSEDEGRTQDHLSLHFCRSFMKDSVRNNTKLELESWRNKEEFKFGE